MTRTITTGLTLGNTVTITGGGCICPECGDDMTPRAPKRCTCPTMIYIQPGHHIHVDCELHGRVRLNGPSVTW